MPRFCTNCGAPLEDSARFCTNCGTQNTDPASVADESAVEEAKVTADIPELTLDETPEIDIPELTLDEAPVESDIPELTLDETPIARPTPPQQPAAEQPENDFIAPPAAPEPPPTTSRRARADRIPIRRRPRHSKGQEQVIRIIRITAAVPRTPSFPARIRRPSAWCWASSPLYAGSLAFLPLFPWSAVSSA